MEELIRIQKLNLEITLGMAEIARKNSAIGQNNSVIQEKQDSIATQITRKANLSLESLDASPEIIAAVQSEISQLEEKMGRLTAIRATNGPTSPLRATLGRMQVVILITAMSFALTLLGIALKEISRVSVRDLEEGKI